MSFFKSNQLGTFRIILPLIISSRLNWISNWRSTYQQHLDRWPHSKQRCVEYGTKGIDISYMKVDCVILRRFNLSSGHYKNYVSVESTMVGTNSMIIGQVGDGRIDKSFNALK